MICFTMRVHSNLVGSVPGKSSCAPNFWGKVKMFFTSGQKWQKLTIFATYNLRTLSYLK